MVAFGGYRSIAGLTQKTAHFAGIMVVVYYRLFHRLIAPSAAAILHGQHMKIVFFRYSVLVYATFEFLAFVLFFFFNKLRGSVSVFKKFHKDAL